LPKIFVESLFLGEQLCQSGDHMGVNYKILCRNFLIIPCRIKGQERPSLHKRGKSFLGDALFISFMCPTNSMPLLLL
jgi:hypothetical protein